jgi:hypothetical protein
MHHVSEKNLELYLNFEFQSLVRNLSAEVVTGVRFIVHQGVLFLQPQVGELGPMGSVYQNTVHWQPVPDNFTRTVSNFEQTNNYFGTDKYWLVDNYLTGLQFTNNGGTLRLRVFGRVIDGQSLAFGLMRKIENIRHRWTLVTEDLRLDSLSKGLASGNDIKYPNFKIIKDRELVFSQQTVGQTLLKFFDNNEATFDIKSPIAGIGFYLYTNSDRHVGFIRPYLQ